MKIRTDFVTNSSSSSFTSIEIESPMLAAIFDKYDEYNTFTVANDDKVVLEDGDEFSCPSIPRSIKDVIDCLIEILEEEWDDDTQDARDAICAELHENKAKLSKDIKTVYWDEVVTGWGGDDLSRYEPSMFSAADRKSMYNDIMEAKGYTDNSQVTEEDWNEYVDDECGGISQHTVGYVYENGKGKTNETMEML